MEQKDFYEVNGCMEFVPVTISEVYDDGVIVTVNNAKRNCMLEVEEVYLFPKVHEPQKPVIPKFVADWVDDSREYRFDFYEWFNWNKQPKTVQLWLNQENKRQAELNALALVTFIVNGANAVEIEQEKLYKLYTVEIPNPNLNAHVVLQKTEKGVVLVTVGNARWKGWESSKLTEAEIRKDFERLWWYAKEVK